MYGAHQLGKATTNWVRAGTDLQPGAMIQVYPGIILNPYLQISTGGKVSTDSTAIGAQIFATVL
jgi:hypothetical protein